MSDVSFPQIEHEILKRWQERDIFKKSLNPKNKAYTFYDGPPFATGLPHYGHLLPSTLKDIVPRYWTMRGYYVERRWGWDCHGLPIEQEIDKKHQFKSTQEIEDFGVGKYNEECRSIVLRFTEEWKKTINRLGRWVDFENGYKTMDRDFMESVWWIFKQLWDKGLIYRDYRVMPFSTPLGTPLSNSEAGSNYMTVQDPAITVTFPLRDDPNTSFLAWTTTPWTLPSNLALAVGQELQYSRIKLEDGRQFILSKELAPQVFKGTTFEELETFRGKDLIGKAYQPLFDYFKDTESPAFTVVHSDHVTTEAGTGIVHIAPAFGEEDFLVGKELGIKPICPVDPHGLFDERVPDYKGLFVKEADKKIIADLKENNRLFKQETLDHAYAFCPRTDTPLINRTVAGWFVDVPKLREKMVQNNRDQTHWVPDHLKLHRFGKWLEGAREWNISRNRFWGNPLPIFEAYEEPLETREAFCVGSVEELESLTGQKFEDIHREHLDDLLIEKNGKKFRRVPEVLDCWFESGAMPYAQEHYPFENKEAFKERFPADFIAEGLDQTRGWFYNLSILGTALFDQVPFRNVVVNGMILAADGKKMSKRLKNYPDPSHVMETYGADALRLYLINSPVIRAEELRLTEEGVKETVRKVILKWWNAYTFYQSYAEIDGYQPQFFEEAPSSKNILDRWILSRLQSLLLNIEREMNVYHLYRVIPEVLQFLEELTNTYIRLNRSRFWSEGFDEDKKQAFDTLFYTLYNFSKVMAPFAPFTSEKIYLLLTAESQKESVHLETYPVGDSRHIERTLETGVATMEEVILLGRQIREQEKIKVKIPLKSIQIIHRRQEVLDALKPLEETIQSELNVKEIIYKSNEADFVDLQCKPNGAVLGRRAGKRMKEVSPKIARLDFDAIEKLDRGEALEIVPGFEIEIDDIKVFRNPVKGSHPVATSTTITVALDTSVERDQELEGLAREVVNRVQSLRKSSGLKLENRIRLQLAAKGDLREASERFQGYIAEQTLSEDTQYVESIGFSYKESFEIDGSSIEIGLEVV